MWRSHAGWSRSRAGRSRSCVAILKPLLLLLTKRDWSGGENIPATGGCVVVVNHVSHLDPITFAHFLYDNGRLPRFLAKAELFDVPVLGRHPAQRRADPGLPPDRRRVAGVRRRRRGGAARASAWSSTPRARSPATPTCGR